MSNIETEIRNMAGYAMNHMKSIDMVFYQGYLVRAANEYQIAIPFDKEEDFADDFVGVHMQTAELWDGEKNIRVLYLCASDKVNMEKIIPVAEQFLAKKYRQQIVDDPYAWFNEWRNIFGDTIKKDSISDLVAEMVAFRSILKIDPTVKWMGPKGGSQDIVGENRLYEVKSTTVKKEFKVYINSAIQLSPNKPESLVFVRLEHKPYGETIESIKKDLVECGVPEEDIEANLIERGIIKGSKLRRIGYDIIEILSYNVTPDLFPIISLEELNKKAPLKNIIDYQFMLELASLPHEILFKKG